MMANAKDNIQVPILGSIRLMSDDEWNKIAYQNWLDRTCKKDNSDQGEVNL